MPEIKPVTSAAAAHDAVSYVAANSSSIEHLQRNLKHGNTFAVFDAFGDIMGVQGRSEGLYYQDTRYLCTFLLLMNGERPMLLNSHIRDNNVLLTVDMTNPDTFVEGKLVMEKDIIHLKRSIFVWEGSLYQRVRVQNFSERRQECTLTLAYGSDFVDLFEVRGGRVHRARGADLHQDQ